MLDSQIVTRTNMSASGLRQGCVRSLLMVMLQFAKYLTLLLCIVWMPWLVEIPTGNHRNLMLTMQINCHVLEGAFTYRRLSIAKHIGYITVVRINKWYLVTCSVYCAGELLRIVDSVSVAIMCTMLRRERKGCGSTYETHIMYNKKNTGNWLQVGFSGIKI